MRQGSGAAELDGWIWMGLLLMVVAVIEYADHCSLPH